MSERAYGPASTSTIELFGTKITTPSVEVTDSMLAGPVAIASDSRFSGAATIARSRISGERRGAITDGGGNQVGSE